MSLERLLAAQTRFDLTSIFYDDVITTILRIIINLCPQRYGKNRSEIKKNVFFPVYGT